MRSIGNLLGGIKRLSADYITKYQSFKIRKVWEIASVSKIKEESHKSGTLGTVFIFWIRGCVSAFTF